MSSRETQKDPPLPGEPDDGDLRQRRVGPLRTDQPRSGTIAASGSFK